VFSLEGKEGPGILVIDEFVATGLVVAAFTTRRGGVSSGPYTALNLGCHTGDLAVNVNRNQRLVCDCLGLQVNSIVSAQQVHGCAIGVVGEDPGTVFGEFDALITDREGVALQLFFADCVPLFFLDPVRRAIGLAHAGWKGSFDNIGLKTIERMRSQFGSRASDILVAIGPCIHRCCYEVSADLGTCFGARYPQYGNKIVEGRFKGNEESFFLDLVELNQLALLDGGIRPDNLVVSGLCTACLPGLFYSHRRDRGVTGRMGAILALTS